jgi:actin-related protein
MDHTRARQDLEVLVSIFIEVLLSDSKAADCPLEIPSTAGIQRKRDDYVGVDAQSQRDILALSRPITQGLVTNWDDMEKLWRHIYNNGV